MNLPLSDPARIFSILVFGIFFVFLAWALHVLYLAPGFEEGVEPLLLAGLLLATTAAIALGYTGAQGLIEFIVVPVRKFRLRAVAGFALLALPAFLLVAWFVLDTFPNSGDELAFVMQAETYAQGRLWVDPPPHSIAFQLLRFFVVDDKWVSAYSPGWAMVLAPAALLHLPLWIVNPIIGATTLIAFFLLARRYVGIESAWLGALLLGISSFFILNSASYFSHSLTGLFGLLFALSGKRYFEKQGIWYAIAAGACIGVVGITRSQNAVIFALPFLTALALNNKCRAGSVWFILGGLPFLALLLAYNAAITGDPLLAVQYVDGDEPLFAFGIRSVALFFGHLIQLYIWTSPVLMFGFWAALAHLVLKRRTDFTDWIMPVTLSFFLFYGGSGGNQYGPRYYFEAWPFAILTIIKVIDPILFVGKPNLRSAWLSSALVASLAFQIGYLPARFEREHRVIVERQDIYTQAENAGLINAVVIVAGPTGTIRRMFTGDLVRNGLKIGDQNIIYAHNLRPSNAQLLAQFPDRSFYAYANGRLFPVPVPVPTPAPEP